MKILVIGASGRIGSLLVEKLTAVGNEVTGTYNSKKIDSMNAIKFDLHASVDQMVSLMQGYEAVYFVAGSRGKDLLQIDLNGAVKVMMASQRVGIKRFIQLSSAFALKQNRWDEGYLKGITDYNIAKYFSDAWLINNTKLNYTILQPSVLTETPATGKVSFDVTAPTENSLSDVAEVLAEILNKQNTIGKVLMMKAGGKSISEAIAQV
ncbi:NAD(P)-binding oxidoreductase [Companilactobacillus huachuanensis]|uniref:NAD(P)-binding oxidoreductase n=1 Tax=Companilactobacillus huachuanensis TaxID=2559914 RepID=A0ABW1RN77_9LACO